jgi:hypothetical protein
VATRTITRLIRAGGPAPSGSLDEPEHGKNNLPDVLARWNLRNGSERERARTEQSFSVPKQESAGEGYDLSLNRYKEVVHEQGEYRTPARSVPALSDRLDREAANDAFGQFLAGKTFNAHQLHFLNLLVDVLAKNGTIDVARLYELPFTARANGGPEDLFTESEVDAIVTVLSEVTATAVPISVAA